MLSSMTGFGSASEEHDWGSATITISSTNARHKEISVSLPKELSHLEYAIQDIIRSFFRRGRAQVRLMVVWAPAFELARIDDEVLEKYYRHLSEVHYRLKLLEEIRLEQLVNLPGVVVVPSKEDEVRKGEIQKSVEGLTKTAALRWQKMRLAEGENIYRNLLKHLEKFEEIIAIIERRWPIAKDSTVDTIKSRLRQVVEGLEVLDEGRLSQEVALLADRWDIEEELSRSRSHAERFRASVDGDDEVGRKLDFLIQEMNREVNAIASKVRDAEMRWLVVEAKTTLEKLREQVQNVE